MSVIVKNLTYIYDEGMPFASKAIDDISFEIKDNDFVGLIGHTGSGKSTLIQHLNGLLKPSSGEIIVNGFNITDKDLNLTEIRKRVGIVFQYPEYQLFEETVEKDIAFGPGNLGLDEEEISKRVRKSMEAVGLDYETYKDNEIVAPMVRQISWTHNVMILGATNSIEEKEFYIKMCIKNNYSKRELDRQISSGYFHRYMLSDGKANQSLSKTVGEEDYPNTKLLDTYSLEFLDLPNQYSEKDLKKAIISNMKDFILEIGKDFTYVGEEYRVQVGNEDFYIDLLFYNRTLSCLVAFELKIGKFKPEYISKMDFYLEALDRQERKENENPSVGVILCASKDDAVVEYALSRSMSPTLVADYRLCLPDKTLLQNKLRELTELALESGEGNEGDEE